MISSFHTGAPASLARSVPIVSPACQKATRASVGSWTSDILPRVKTSNGSALTLPPASATLAVAASTSSTARETAQYGGWPASSGIIPEMPATRSPSILPTV